MAAIQCTIPGLFGRRCDTFPEPPFSKPSLSASNTCAIRRCHPWGLLLLTASRLPCAEFIFIFFALSSKGHDEMVKIKYIYIFNQQSSQKSKSHTSWIMNGKVWRMRRCERVNYVCIPHLKRDRELSLEKCHTSLKRRSTISRRKLSALRFLFSMSCCDQ